MSNLCTPVINQLSSKGFMLSLLCFPLLVLVAVFSSLMTAVTKDGQFSQASCLQPETLANECNQHNIT
jgi:hypothetical protein